MSNIASKGVCHALCNVFVLSNNVVSNKVVKCSKTFSKPNLLTTYVPRIRYNLTDTTRNTGVSKGHLHFRYIRTGNCSLNAETGFLRGQWICRRK